MRRAYRRGPYGKAKVIRAIEDTKLSPVQSRMARILLVINGPDNALEFIRKVSAMPSFTSSEKGLE